jgi:hypothetical protein
MGAREHVDAVDLVKRQPLDRTAQMALVDDRRQGAAKALRAERDPPRRAGGQPLDRRRFDQDSSSCAARRA